MPISDLCTNKKYVFDNDHLTMWKWTHVMYKPFLKKVENMKL